MADILTHWFNYTEYYTELHKLNIIINGYIQFRNFWKVLLKKNNISVGSSGLKSSPSIA